MVLTDNDVALLSQCVELARCALDAGYEPVGALLVEADGAVLATEHHRATDTDPTAHAELALTRWAADNVAPVRRIRTTVYTSGEHCPMCAAAHAWAGLGRIVYASSAQQLAQWRSECGLPPAPVAPLPISTVAPRVIADGPAPQLHDQMKALYAAGLRP